MKFPIAAASLAILAQQAAAHATWQNLWVGGHGSTCARVPPSNSPVTVPTSQDIRCNVGGTKGVSGKCAVQAGAAMAIEMHQQPGDRSCSNEPIGGAHYGPVQVYLSKVDDAASADGSSGWFKIMSNGWAAAPGSTVGDNDYWGTKDLNKCCGQMGFIIPANIPSGDYLLRAEALALHTQPGQFYMTCYQITVTGGAGSLPASLVKFPGAYSASDSGISANIHAKLTSYTPPGPAVIAGGKTIIPGNPTCPATKKRSVFSA